MKLPRLLLLSWFFTISLASAQNTAPAPGSIPPDQPESRGEKWESRALGAVASSDKVKQDVQLIFDGDSITDFWKGRAPKIWEERYGKYHPIDFAISGDKTQQVLWRLAHGQADGFHPKLIALMIGTNNVRQKQTPEEIASGVKAILAEYQRKCPDAVILLQAIFPRAHLPTDPDRQKVAAINKILATYEDGSKIIYIDFGDKFLEPDGTLSREIMPDYLHPSLKGYQIWADAIQPTVDKYLANK